MESSEGEKQMKRVHGVRQELHEESSGKKPEPAGGTGSQSPSHLRIARCYCSLRASPGKQATRAVWQADPSWQGVISQKENKAPA